LPEPLVDEVASGDAAGAGEDEVAGCDHEKCAAEHGFFGDEADVVGVVAVVVCQDGGEGCEISI
jgi:hypothetical protein